MTTRAFWIVVTNLLTLARLCAVPLAVWLVMSGQSAIAFWVFLLAGLTDALDGILAKYLDAETTIGGFLDPLADKALLVGIYIALGHEGALPLWLVILVIFRDVLIVGGVILLQSLAKEVRMAPLKISKLNTGMQIALAVVVLGGLGYGVAVPGLVTALVWAVAATTVASGIGYIFGWGRRLLMEEEP